MSDKKKESGAHDRGKPIAPKEGNGHHSGRKHPPVVDPHKVVKGLSKDLKVSDKK